MDVYHHQKKNNINQRLCLSVGNSISLPHVPLFKNIVHILFYGETVNNPFFFL